MCIDMHIGIGTGGGRRVMGSQSFVIQINPFKSLWPPRLECFPKLLCTDTEEEHTS